MGAGEGGDAQGDAPLLNPRPLAPLSEALGGPGAPPPDPRSGALTAQRRTVVVTARVPPRGRPLSEAAIAKMVRDLRIAAVPHGFRSSFRDWAAECSDAPREVCELALAHVNTNSIEAAYRRTDMFERRRALMEHWAAFLGGTQDKVAPRSGRAA